MSRAVQRIPNVAVEAERVSKVFRLYRSQGHRVREWFMLGQRRLHRQVEALKNVSFSVNCGEAMGVIGDNGSGKSTLLRVLGGILAPSAGQVALHYPTSVLIELAAGYDIQASGSDNVVFQCRLLGMGNGEISERMAEIVEFAELGPAMDLPMKTYSTGMKLRLAFSVALGLRRKIMLIDEVLAVGDEYFQAKCFRKIQEIKETDQTIVYVSHALGTVRSVCEKSLWLREGEVAAEGESWKVIDQYLDYVRGRMGLTVLPARPQLEQPKRQLEEEGQGSADQGVEERSEVEEGEDDETSRCFRQLDASSAGDKDVQPGGEAASGQPEAKGDGSGERDTADPLECEAEVVGRVPEAQSQSVPEAQSEPVPEAQSQSVPEQWPAVLPDGFLLRSLPPLRLDSDDRRPAVGLDATPLDQVRDIPSPASPGASRLSDKALLEHARQGSHEVEIFLVEVLDERGKPRSRFVADEALVVRLHFMAHEAVERPNFGVAIYRNDGLLVYGTSSYKDDMVIDRVEGRGVVDYVIQNLHILSGSYEITCAIFDEDDIYKFDYHTRLYPFAVDNPRHDEGVMRQCHRWQMRGGGSGIRARTEDD